MMKLRYIDWENMVMSWETADPRIIITDDELVGLAKVLFDPGRFDPPKRKFFKKAKHMTTTVLREIGAFLLGRKYWANIVKSRWPDPNGNDYSLSSFIFNSREEAEWHRRSMEGNRSYEYIETVTFRSRRAYHQSKVKP